MGVIDGSITIACDSSAITRAADELERLARAHDALEARGIAVPPMSVLVAGAHVIANPQPVTRRSLFFWWRR